MKITFKIDQVTALRNGIDAPSSTAAIEVDPAQLTQEQRNVLASWIRDAHDATRAGPSLARPDVQGIVEKIDEVMARAAEAESAKLAEARVSAFTLANIRADYLQRPVGDLINSKNCPATVWAAHCANRHGPLIYNEKLGTLADLTGRGAEVDTVLAERRAVAEAVRIEAEAEAMAKKSQIEAEYAALYARLPETLRARDQGGYASEDEILRAIRALVRADEGYTHAFIPWDGSKKLETLTDAQYATLMAAKEAAPQAFDDVEAVECWDGTRGYRSAEEHEMEEADDDGEIYESGENVRQQIVITWSRGGVRTKVALPL